MAYVWKLVCGDETLQLNGTDNSTYKVLDGDVRWAAGELRLPIAINREGGGAVGTMQRLDREIRRFMQKASAWADRREGKPVDLVCKIDDGLGDIEPLYGRGMSRLRVLAGRSNLAALMPRAAARGTIVAELTLYTRPYYHGKLTDVADATGWVRETPEKGLEVWEATTNLLVNPCLAFPTDWDQRWAVYNATDLVLSQSTSIWRSLGSAAKLRAAATTGGVFYDDIVLTNAAHTLSCYVHKEGAVPTTADVEMWAGHVFENFTTAAAAPTAPLVEATAGGGNVVIAGGECQCDTTGAVADAAMVYYNAALNAYRIWRVSVQGHVATITAGQGAYLRIVDSAAAPAVDLAGATTIFAIRQDATGIVMTYTDNTGTTQYWNGVTNAWGPGVAYALTVATGSTYRVDVVSTGPAWYMVLYTDADVVLETTTSVTYALTRAIANNLWFCCGDMYTGINRVDQYFSYIRISVGVLTTTFTADPEHPGWYRATSAAFTMPAVSVNCGVNVKAGRYVYVDDFQVEAKAYATPDACGDLLGCAWSGTAHDSTSVRTAGQVILNPRNFRADHGAVTFWYKPGLVYSSLPNGMLAHFYQNATNEIELYWEGGTDTFQASINGGAAVLTSAVQSFTAGQEIFIGLVWDFTTDTYALYTDATVDTDATAMVASTLTAAGNIYIGCSSAGAAQMNGTIYDPRIWPEALTAAQIGLVRTAGRGLGELPWLWTAAADGVVNNCEDSTYVGSAWLGGIPGDMPAGMKLWVDPTPGEDAAVFTSANATDHYWIALKPLDKGAYQSKYRYILEAESMTWPGAGEAIVADVDHSGGNYVTNTGSDDPYGNLATTSADLFKLHGRWRIFARAATTAAAGTFNWTLGIASIRLKDNTFSFTRAFNDIGVSGNALTDSYNWLDLGVVDIPPAASSDSAYGELFPVFGTADYLSILLDLNEVAGADTFRMDCLELIPDEMLLHVYTFVDLTYRYYPLLIDSTLEPQVTTVVYKHGENELLAGVVGNGAALQPVSTYPSRLIVRKGAGTYHNISAAVAAVRVSADLFAQIEPRFEALR